MRDNIIITFSWKLNSFDVERVLIRVISYLNTKKW